MDLHTPLTPDLEGFRAKVLAVKPRTYVCCICHGKMGRLGPNDNLFRGERLCNHPSCYLAAVRLDWLGR